jgi:hypothetical protein
MPKATNLNLSSLKIDRTQSIWSLTYYPKQYLAEGSIRLGGKKYPISCKKSNQYQDSEPLKPEVEQPPVILNPRSEQPNSVNLLSRSK